MYHTLGILLVSFGLACSRDTSKTFRSMPAISNSLVNLGKIDINFHINEKPGDGHMQLLSQSASPFFPRSEPIQHTVEFEPCPCSSLKNFKNPFDFPSGPTNILSKILKSSDLFSFNQEHTISPMCCNSHEHQEETVFFDFSPNKYSHPQAPTRSPLPFDLLNSLLPKLPSSLNNKPNAVEIFFFPKNKNGMLDLTKMSTSPRSMIAKKNEIQIVGDKEIKNEFKSFKYKPTLISKKDRESANEQAKQNENEHKQGETAIKVEEKPEYGLGVKKEKIDPPPFTPTTTA